MPLETVSKVFERLMNAPFVGESFTAVWHAGEPLTVGVDFYRSASVLSKKLLDRGCRVRHSVQTNATLIDDDWCRWFKEEDVRVGVSIDGPEFINDRNRKDRSARGTYDRAMKGIGLLKHNGVPFHTICVLTKFSLNYPEELFAYFQSIGTQCVCFNVEEVEGVHTTSTMSGADVAELFRKFLRKFLSLSIPAKMMVREFSSLRSLILSGIYDEVNGLSTPYAVLSVAANGDYGTFSPELLTMKHDAYPDFIFGNVHEGDFIQMLDSENFRKVHSAIEAGIEKCRSLCGYFALCGGGAPSNKIFENGTFDSTETTFCRCSKQAVIDVVLPMVENQVDLEVARV
jgi:uncharacterized protein